MLINAADESSIVSPSDILTRNAAVMYQLTAEHLRAIDVEGDNNCYYRALAVCLYGNERRHASLRATVARHIGKQADTASLADGAVLRKRAADVACDGHWPGEDVIVATANSLQRTIQIYLAAGANSPRLYSPQPASGKVMPPLKLAFLEPGHYNAVVNKQACEGNDLAPAQ